MQERWKWLVTHYEIEHTLWKHPHNYILINGKQAALMGYHIQECDPSYFPLSLEDLCKVEKQSHGEAGAYMNASQKQLMSMLWKVGGEGNPIKGSQPPLLCDVSLEMHCLQLVHKTLHKTNTYHMDDRNEKANYVDPDWEVITADLVHEIVHQYMLQGINIPESIIAKLSSYQMSLGDAAHKNYTMIDDWVSEALHRLRLPAIVAGGFAAHRLGHITHCNDIDIFVYVPPWFDISTLPWRFGPCFPNVHRGRHAPAGLKWPKSSTSHNQPKVSWHVKVAPVDGYNSLSMVGQCDSAGTTKMGLVECVLSAPTNPSVKFLVNPFENPVFVQFILLYAKSEAECLELYADTSLMVQKILDGFDIDPCRCFGVKWKRPVHEAPCMLKLGNSDMIYMQTFDKGVWPAQHHVDSWDIMWNRGKQHGMPLYSHVYNMCLNGKLPWAVKQAEVYVHVYQVCLNPLQTQMA